MSVPGAGVAVGDLDAAEGADAFLRHMLWRYPGQRQPIVALLGPRRSGKTDVLRAVSRACGGTVIHAALDFEENPVDPVSAAALAAFQMMRGWDNLRHGPVFHRFGLGLLALNENLDADRGRAAEQIRELIKQYVRSTPPGRIADRLGNAAAGTMDIVAQGVLSPLVSGPAREVVTAVREQAKPVIGSLFQSAARWGVRDALRWHISVPEAESARSIDALIRLSSTSRSAAVGPLMAAFLADVKAQAERHPPLRSACSCVLPTRGGRRDRHDHAWVLLADGAQTPAGRRFLTELAAARARNQLADLDGTGAADPLLVLSACEQWQSEWTSWWCEPWRSTPLPGTPQRRVPLLSRATRTLWAAENDAAVGAERGPAAAWWYPVWLDPMTEEQVGSTMDRSDPSPARPLPASVVHRLTGGHRGAVSAVLDGPFTAHPGPRGPAVSMVAPADEDGTPLWSYALEAGLPDGLPVPGAHWSTTPAVVLAAAYLADVRTAHDPRLLALSPELPRSLELLRRHLWVSTFTHRPSRIRQIGWGEADVPATLHPWLARSALTALNTAPPARPTDPAPWHEVFAAQSRALTESVTPGGDGAAVERALFHDLALGRFAPVAAALADRFDEDHRAWIRLLDYLASAPCRLLYDHAPQDAYATLLDGVEDGGQTVFAVATAKLLALLWLYNDPLTEHTRRWDGEIQECFTRLAHNSRLLDVSPLQQAAAAFA
ncbi:hypothetical protein ABZ726_29995 [Streptomyces hundungensis]|uniref:hypothetical protein n=1 Tax=Streptomyces hundungensis TaxID=1077946 RepID=UPI00340470C0